jgi:hypothetical protein
MFLCALRGLSGEKLFDSEVKLRCTLSRHDRQDSLIVR